MVWRLEKKSVGGREGGCYFSQGPEKARKGSMKEVKTEIPAGICREVAGPTSAQVVRWECAQHVQGTAQKPMWPEHRCKGQEMGWDMGWRPW